MTIVVAPAPPLAPRKARIWPDGSVDWAGAQRSRSRTSAWLSCSVSTGLLRYSTQPARMASIIRPALDFFDIAINITFVPSNCWKEVAVSMARLRSRSKSMMQTQRSAFFISCKMPKSWFCGRYWRIAATAGFLNNLAASRDMELMVSTSAHTVTMQTLLLAGILSGGIWLWPCPFPLLIWHLSWQVSRCGRARESNRNAWLPDLAEHAVWRLAVEKAWVF